MKPLKLPRLELKEDPNNKNEFIIFRHQIKGNKKSNSIIKNKPLVKKTRKHKKNITKKHKKKKSLFNLF